MSDNLVVLAGMNGCGKTSVLEICQLALGYDGFLQRKEPCAQDFAIEMEIAIENRESTCALLRRYPNDHLIIREDGEEFLFKKESSKIIGRFSMFCFPSWRMPKLVGSLGMSVGRGKKPERSDPANVLWRLKQRLINLKGMRGFASQSELQIEMSSDDVFARLNRAWKMFYPNSDLTFDAEIVPNVVSDSNRDIEFDVFLRNESGSFRVPIDFLSSGEIEILCFLGVLICKTTPYDVVFIDEPELHLNVQWHRVILKALQQLSPTTQFIVATHSSEIWDQAYSTQRFMLPRLGDLK